LNSSMARRLLVQSDPDAMAPQRQPILFRPASELFLSSSDAGQKTPLNSIHSVTPRRFVIHSSARLALLLEARAAHTTIFHSAERPERTHGQRMFRGSTTFRAVQRFQVGSALQEITSTKWQKN